MGIYRNKYLLIVNIASKCRYASINMRGLSTLQEMFKDDDFEVLAFPCGQFMMQEPCDNLEIKKYSDELKLNFKVFGKIMINGPFTSPVYQYLRSKSVLNNEKTKISDPITWNFEKFFIDKNGNIVKHWLSCDPINPYDFLNEI
mmetsp:Transcript_61146/g.51730  ORF Transcript_61146/g.51730 Transcript_61146/m.51730 type:complete len:144 (-) Transcript_61146:151-582(-)